MQRRSFLKGTLGASAMAVAVGAGLLNPRQALAAWPKAAFDAKSVPDALNDLVGTGTTSPS
ncbi:MAG TPA: twin-arginine translocation signal domain-containing protein, partial [Gammaproteobacteria bacterium]|nr:twin-arginine translocation signal domain-containing protein [Gammaproteobacteria bacterium]